MLTTDPLANGYDIRLICVDRPGTGAVPMVPLADRIDMSCSEQRPSRLSTDPQR